MSQPKVIHSLLLLLFFSLVAGSIFFLLSLQLYPLLTEIGQSISTTNSVMAEEAHPRPTPTPTMVDLTLDMVAAVSPTLAPSTPTAAPAALLPSTAPTQVGIVTSDVVNLRSYPNVAGEVVGQVQQGERFQIVAISHDGLWVHICCPLGTSEATRQSWVAREFIAVEPALTAAQLSIPTITVARASVPTGADAVHGTITGVLVNLRSGPDTAYPTVGQVSEQTIVTITGRNAEGTWWQICCPPGAPQASWINAEFVEITVPKEQMMAQVATAIVP